MDMAGHGRMMAEVDGVRVAIRSTVLYHSTLIMKRAEVIYHQLIKLVSAAIQQGFFYLLKYFTLMFAAS